MAYTVLKVFNNNIVLVTDGDAERLLIGKGIGFGRKPGTPLGEVAVEVEKVFVIEQPEKQQQFRQLIETNDPGFIDFCEDLILQIFRELQTELDERIHIGLLDHLAMTIRRLRKGDEIVNPFLAQTKVLYPREYRVATQIAARIDAEYGVSVPPGEAGFIALHIHSAVRGVALSDTLRSNRISAVVVQRIREWGIEVDEGSIEYARFLSHLRYTMERTLKGGTVEDGLAKAIAAQYPESNELARELRVLLEKELKSAVSDAEVAFLTVHLERLRA